MRKKTGIFVAIIFALAAFVLPLAGCAPRAKAEEQTGKRVLVLMYHSVNNVKNSKFKVQPARLREDVRWLKAHGYAGVRLADVVAYAKGEGELPDKAVALTFDDCRYDVHKYAYPILSEEGMFGVMNVIGSFSDYSTASGDCNNPAYSCMTWAQVKEFWDSGVFEIGNHSYNMHSYKGRYGIRRNKDETAEDYRAALTADTMRLQQKFEEIGIKSNIYAYPFGAYSKESENVLADLGFEVVLTCNDSFNNINVGDTAKLRRMNRFNRDGDLPTPDFFSRIGA